MDIDDSNLIDLQRYPIDALDRAPGQALLACCRAELAERRCCSLPGFVPPKTLAKMLEEARAASAFGHSSGTCTNPYFTEDDPSLPPEHPQRWFQPRSNAFVPADAIPPESHLRALYRYPCFMPFVQACLEEPELHEYADPLADVILNIVEPDGQFPWHFDTNEFSVSLMIQPAEAGGLFEYVPNLRSPDDENYPGVAEVLAGDRRDVRTLELRPGDLQIFKGRFTLHRVTAVDGETPRYLAIFSYTRRPGVIGKVHRMRELYGKVLSIHEENETTAIRSDALSD